MPVSGSKPTKTQKEDLAPSSSQKSDVKFQSQIEVQPPSFLNDSPDTPSKQYQIKKPKELQMEKL